MTDPTPSAEAHWYPCDVENQAPHDQVLSLQALVTEAGAWGRATREAILADLLDRGLAVSKADLSRVWDELA
jgi:hypothetical protein